MTRRPTANLDGPRTAGTPIAGGDLFAPPAPAAAPARVQRVTPPHRPCEKCGKEMGFVTNEDTGNDGPIDVKAVVYATFLPAGPVTPPLPGDRPPTFPAMTTKALAESGARLVFPDGREVPIADVGFYVSHYATCPSAAHFSRKGGYRR